MSKIIKEIALTEEEKKILAQAADILNDVADDLDYDNINGYTNAEFITNIMRIHFEM